MDARNGVCDDTLPRVCPCRLEARRIFNEIDSDRNGMLDAREIKAGFRRLGMPFITDGQVAKIMAEFDVNGDGGIDEVEFVEYYGRIFEQRDSSIIGKIIHAVLFFPRKRISQVRSARFVQRFRCVRHFLGDILNGGILRTSPPPRRSECAKRDVPIGEALEARITNIANQETTHGEAIASGKLDLYNTGANISAICPPRVLCSADDASVTV